MQRLSSTLAKCAAITNLKLESIDLSAEQIATALAGMPRLRRLELAGLVTLHSLSFLSSLPHLASTLIDFSLSYCHHVPPSQLRHVHSLLSVERLRLARG